MVFFDFFESKPSEVVRTAANKILDISEGEGVTYEPKPDAAHTNIKQVLNQNARRILLPH